MQRAWIPPWYLFAAVCLLNFGCATSGDDNKEARPAADPDVKVKIEDLKVGTGPEAKLGDHIEVHYTGWLLDGKQFDSSYDRGEPYPIQLGKSQVIKGWHDGIAGMKAGGKRKLTIPPELAYGKSGRGIIPPNATLVFEIDLVRIK